MESVTDQFTFFRMPSNQVHSFQRRTYDCNAKKQVITKLTLPLGFVELLISIALLGGFIAPLKASEMYIVWTFTSFGILFGFSGVLSIVAAWCGTLPVYFVIIHLVFSIVTLAFVCLACYIASIVSNQRQWHEHIILFIVLITVQGTASLTSFFIILRFLFNSCNTSTEKHQSLAYIDPETTISNVPLNNNCVEDDSAFELTNDLQNAPIFNLPEKPTDPPGTPPPTYLEVRSSCVYGGMT